MRRAWMKQSLVFLFIRKQMDSGAEIEAKPLRLIVLGCSFLLPQSSPGCHVQSPERDHPRP